MITAELALLPLSRVHRGRPAPRTICTLCLQPGHNRRRHGAVPIGPRKDPGYSKAWGKNLRLRAAMKALCLDCNDPVDRKTPKGDPAPVCKACTKARREGERRRRRLATACIRLVERIAAGQVADPVAEACAVLAEVSR